MHTLLAYMFGEMSIFHRDKSGQFDVADIDAVGTRRLSVCPQQKRMFFQFIPTCINTSACVHRHRKCVCMHTPAQSLYEISVRELRYWTVSDGHSRLQVFNTSYSNPEFSCHVKMSPAYTCMHTHTCIDTHASTHMH